MGFVDIFNLSRLAISSALPDTTSGICMLLSWYWMVFIRVFLFKLSPLHTLNKMLVILPALWVCQSWVCLLLWGFWVFHTGEGGCFFSCWGRLPHMYPLAHWVWVWGHTWHWQLWSIPQLRLRCCVTVSGFMLVRTPASGATKWSAWMSSVSSRGRTEENNI